LLVERHGGAVLHVRGRDQAFDLAASLQSSGLSARAVIAYAAEPAATLSDTALAALRGGAAVLVHSPKGAARFVGLASRHCAESLIHTAPCAAISSAAAAPLVRSGAQRVEIAETPDEEALFGALARALR
jgi:uroporphyrinogen-III synthase